MKSYLKYRIRNFFCSYNSEPYLRPKPARYLLILFQPFLVSQSVKNIFCSIFTHSSEIVNHGFFSGITRPILAEILLSSHDGVTTTGWYFTALLPISWFKVETLPELVVEDRISNRCFIFMYSCNFSSLFFTFSNLSI